MDKQESLEETYEVQWMENWDRRRRIAVVQVLCYVVNAIYVYHVYYRRHYDVPGKSLKGKKRKANMWERELKKIKDAVGDVAEAIREGNAVMERGQAHVYSEEEVFEEPVNIGVEKHLFYSAYIFLLQDPARASMSSFSWNFIHSVLKSLWQFEQPQRIGDRSPGAHATSGVVFCHQNHHQGL